jgi:hypothetical protein
LVLLGETHAFFFEDALGEGFELLGQLLAGRRQQLQLFLGGVPALFEGAAQRGAIRLQPGLASLQLADALLALLQQPGQPRQLLVAGMGDIALALGAAEFVAQLLQLLVLVLQLLLGPLGARAAVAQFTIRGQQALLQCMRLFRQAGAGAQMRPQQCQQQRYHHDRSRGERTPHHRFSQLVASHRLSQRLFGGKPPWLIYICAVRASR